MDAVPIIRIDIKGVKLRVAQMFTVRNEEINANAHVHACNALLCKQLQ